jgi:guanylate kinase
MSADPTSTAEPEHDPAAPRRGRLTVLAGPTAVGKGTIAAYVRTHFPGVWFSVSMTTRRPRPGEVDGVHYHFVDDHEFDRLVEAGEFLEYAVVHGAAKYGTPRGPVERVIREGRDALLEIDLQGARQVRDTWPDALFVFLAPPSWEELVRRLIGRGTEDPEVIERRLEAARTELAAEEEFEATLVNTSVEDVSAELLALMRIA